MRKPLMLIPTILLLAACNDVTGVDGPDTRGDIRASVTERCDPPRFEAYGKCHDRRGPKPVIE
ncbi:MAG: hypothetical protein V3T16_03825 [Gemmatimonadales bacterium]